MSLNREAMFDIIKGADMGLRGIVTSASTGEPVAVPFSPHTVRVPRVPTSIVVDVGGLVNCIPRSSRSKYTEDQNSDDGNDNYLFHIPMPPCIRKTDDIRPSGQLSRKYISEKFE
jgi:hypothetical protein